MRRWWGILSAYGLGRTEDAPGETEHFMWRRVVIAFACGLFLLLAAAIVPWGLSSAALSAVSHRFKELYGLELSVAGRATIAILPVPRVKFRDFTLTTSDAVIVARGGFIRGEFHVLPALAGRLELSEIAIANAVIDVEADGEGGSLWKAALDKLREPVGTQRGHGSVRRLVLDGTHVRFLDRRTGSAAQLSELSLVAHLPAAGKPFEVSGSATWKGETVTLAAVSVRPGALALGRSSRLNVQLSAPSARLTFAGEASMGDDPRFAGRAAISIPSLRRFSAWSGLHLPFGSVAQALAVEGDVVADRRGASWPAAQVKLGVDRLDGALSARLDAERPVIAGTLAADQLDLTGVFASLFDTGWSPRPWSAAAQGRGPQAAADLDLRLSASNLRIGALRMQDLAANVSATPGRYDISIGRVAASKGVGKGRVVLASTSGGLAIKGQGAFERLDLGALLLEFGRSRWIGGAAQGQFTLEGSGSSAAELMARLQGRGHVTIRQGELVGVGLSDALRRIEKGPSSVPLQWSGGRMAFDQAALDLIFSGGSAYIMDGELTAAGLRAVLQGRVSMMERNVALRADVENVPAAGGASSVAVDVSGPWSGLTIASRRNGSGDSASAH
jgi:AsmA protein